MKGETSFPGARQPTSTPKPQMRRRRRTDLTTGRAPQSPGDESGSALVELTWLGLLLLIPLVYVIVTLVTVQRSAYGATEAARAAGRAFVLAPDVPTARLRAFDAARVAMLDQGVAIQPGDLLIACQPSPDACLQAGSTVQVTVDLEVRLPLMPSVLGRSAASVSVDASHTEPYGIFREAAP